MKPEFGLDLEKRSLIESVFQKYPKIEKVVVYGSRAMGNYKPTSDIDLAFYGDFEWGFEGKLLEDLDALPTPYLFDVTDYRRIESQALKEHIDQHGKVIYKRLP